MDKIFDAEKFKQITEAALIKGLDFIAENRIYSVWTDRNTGWQEQWEQSQFSGLYATSSALMILLPYHDRYDLIIRDALKELRDAFDDNAYRASSENSDEKHEAVRRERSKLILEQNCHTTLKAVYFLRACERLNSYGYTVFDKSNAELIIEKVYNQVRCAFDEKTGLYAPAKNNFSDVSMLTSMHAYILMKDVWGAGSENFKITTEKFLDWLRQYKARSMAYDVFAETKFERFEIKRNAVIAIYALSHCLDALSETQKELLREVVYATMTDVEIRDGFMIKDSYIVPDTMFARDTYSTDSKLLYLDGAIMLIENGVLPCAMLEYFLDDVIDIIDTVNMKSKYLSWDMSPSFSYNVNGLKVLQSVLSLLDKQKCRFVAQKITPKSLGRVPRSVDPRSVVIFMPFSKDYSSSFLYTVNEILSFLGYDVWCASNDPYDASVMDNIWGRLTRAQFVIIDCSSRSVNVMYEAGLSHGLGKQALLCGYDKTDFPYEDDSPYDVCYYSCDGESNPPPYRDLQKGIIDFILGHLDDFCVSEAQKQEIRMQVKEFSELYFEV